MSEVVTGVLKLAFGFISNKIRDYGAEKLQDGGLTDQKFRGLVVREMDDIKSKLDAISRKDLGTSISSLREGIDRLSLSFDEFSNSRNQCTSEVPTAKESPDATKPAQQSVTVEDAVALANVIGNLKIVSNERFELAKKSFEKAAEKASEAFHNTALSTDERILASKVRIASAILQHLDDPEIAASDCLNSLRELNDMPSIQEIFSVHLKGGIKSVFKKESRVEVVETVTMINLILADFISKFTKRRMAVLDWPMIKCGKRVVHPIHYDQRRLPNLKEMGITAPWDIVVLKVEITSKRGLTRKGDLICLPNDGGGPQKLDKTTGKLQPYCLSPLEDNTEHPQPLGEAIDLAFDEDDTMYVFSRDRGRDYTLSVYSADGRNMCHCILKFLEEKICRDSHITVTNDKKIVISCGYYYKTRNIMVYLCNSDGKLINSFDTGLRSGISYNEHYIEFVSVSFDNKIILVTTAGRAKAQVSFEDSQSHMLYIYTEDGELLQRAVKLHSSEADNLLDRRCTIFYNQVTENISHVMAMAPYLAGKILIEYLSGETAECQCSCLLYGTNFPEGIPAHCSHLVCNTNGAVALVSENRVIFLQKPSL
ncbi:Hypothetical predicted protein [Paramuricea clavata]|uniref:Uncharacterized protein n=1 Tax=Paramuricea clavata TaxID=317549 RepID=A0A6S7J4A9_PARCT|nr:Hypothetical predicted protein [Paramuricea clavata]